MGDLINRERLKALFLELVRIDAHSRREAAMAARLKQELESLGAGCEYDNAGEKVNGNTGNLIGRLDGNRPGAPPLLLCAHLDTVVPGEGVKPVVEGDIIRSDGTTVLGADDKSGCAIICEVLRQLREHRLSHGPLDVVFTICEEVGLLGAKHLDLARVRAREGLVFDSDLPGALYVRAPGAFSLLFAVKGLEAHAGMCPERGISAIKVAAEAVAAMRLGRIDEETTANLGLIEGGRAVNVVPSQVTLHGEARSRNEAKLTAQVEHMVSCFKEAVARHRMTLEGRTFNAELDYSAEREYPAMDLSDDAPIVRRVIEAARRVQRKVVPAAMGGACDANIFNGRGLMVANLGTGMREVHTLRECIDLNDMVAAAETTLELVKLYAAA